MRSGNSNSGSGNRNGGGGSGGGNRGAGSGGRGSGGGNRGAGAGGGRGGAGGRGAGGGRGASGGGGWDNRGGGAGNRGSNPGARTSGSGREDEQKRPSRPRPEERRYDVGRSGPTGGAGAKGTPRGTGRAGGSAAFTRDARDGDDERRGGGARGAAARGGAKGGPRSSQSAPRARRDSQGQSRPRELDAKIEQRNRDRYADAPEIRTPKTNPNDEGERLQKVLARAGMGSRRACEELIEQSRVEVNGEIVLEQGMRVDPDQDEIKVDGLTVATQSHLFFALNKPAGVVSTMEDPDGRQSLGDYVTNRETRLFHVGRLDTETEGIILLTNHGELAHRLTHPRYGVKKIYLAAIQGPLPRDLGKRLKDGIQLEDGYAKADHFRVVENTGKNYLVEVTLHEGRKHIVRRMLAEAGFPVDRLVRTSFGPIPLGDQKSGWLRRLTNTEVGMLMKEVGL
ncbi:pseudouridine synthase [Streptomyces sp. NBC_00370]|uniref:pseudouridine synthase n=2 Tax=unclassified Streptomyces TaxID=2593676 RepID=UPI002E26616F